jgi:hypothetical protein
MRIAYLMTVHRNPLLLKRLIGTLSVGSSGFFIHIDQKTDISKFSEIGGGGVFLSQNRIPVYWCEFSQVEATILLMRQALACRENYGYFVFLQGSDYPIRSGTYIQRFFEVNRGDEFISIAKIPAPGYPLSKVNDLWYPSEKPVRRFARKALAKLGLGHRDYKNILEGSTPMPATLAGHYHGRRASMSCSSRSLIHMSRSTSEILALLMKCTFTLF